jgi:hypothetical protein
MSDLYSIYIANTLKEFIAMLRFWRIKNFEDVILWLKGIGHVFNFFMRQIFAKYINRCYNNPTFLRCNKKLHFNFNLHLATLVWCTQQVNMRNLADFFSAFVGNPKQTYVPFLLIAGLYQRESQKDWKFTKNFQTSLIINYILVDNRVISLGFQLH